MDILQQTVLRPALYLTKKKIKKSKMATQDAFKNLNKNMHLIEQTIQNLTEFIKNQQANMLKIIEIKESGVANQIDALAKQVATNKTESEASTAELKAYVRGDLFMNYVRAKIQTAFMAIVEEKLELVKVALIKSTE